MSEPIRYRPDWTYTGTAFVPFCRQQDNGEFVRYEDYARLKAEVERLIKAGDALGSALILFELKSEEERQERLKNWAIAKYGEPRNG